MTNKKQILTIIGFIVLLVAIPVTFYLVRHPQIFKSRAAFTTSFVLLDANRSPLPQASGVFQTRTSSVTLNITRVETSPSPSPVVSPSPAASSSPGPLLIDTLDYFLSDHPDKGLDGEHSTGSTTDLINGHPLSQKVEGQKSYYTKWDSKVFEIHTWDDNFIYLKEDHSGAPVNFNSFNPGKWLKRQMNIGDKITVSDNIIQWYGPTCAPLTNGPFPIELTMESRVLDYDLGGALNRQDVIVVKYDPSVGLTTGVYEKYYYSKEWGWVRWEEYDKSTNILRNRRTFNKIMDNPIQPDKTVACTNPVSSPVPSSSPASSPSPAGGTLFRVSFEAGFPSDKTQQGNLDSVTGQAIISVTLPQAGLNTAYIQFSDDGGVSWHPATAQIAQITLTQ